MNETARQWWPLEWADEVMPPGRSTPDGFLVITQELGQPPSYRLGYTDDDRLASEAFKSLQQPVAEGDVVSFICCDPLGEIEVTIARDGSFVAHDLIDPRATHFHEIGDVDSLASSLSEFAKQFVDNNKHVQSWPVNVTVATAWWSDALPHKLIVTANGPMFEAVSAAEARQ